MTPPHISKGALKAISILDGESPAYPLRFQEPGKVGKPCNWQVWDDAESQDEQDMDHASEELSLTVAPR